MICWESNPNPRPVVAFSDEEQIALFQSFIRIPTVSSTGVSSGSYNRAAKWLKEQCFSLNLDVVVLEPVKGKPIVLARWAGTETDKKLPAILLNSHYDVVPAMEEHWKHDPFSAVRTKEDGGRIYGRGTQDMKCVCVQYLLAIRELMVANQDASAKAMRRTIFLSFVPDEEIGGRDGMGAFLASPEFAALPPIGLALDEGLANDSPTGEYTVFYGERSPWWILVKAKGPTGHGSRFIEDPATHKLIRVAQKAIAYRNEQEERLGYNDSNTHTKCKGGCKHAQAKKLGDVTTINLTMLKAGVTGDGGKTWNLNVLPIEAEAGFDIRIPPSCPMETIKSLLDTWTAEEGLSWEFAPWVSRGLQRHYVTGVGADAGSLVGAVTDSEKTNSKKRKRKENQEEEEEDPWWKVFKDAAVAAGIKVCPEVFPAATDSRFLRKLGIPALGFSPMSQTPILLHEHNEWLGIQTFLNGVQVYKKMFPVLANSIAS
eukprot:g2368.t1